MSVNCFTDETCKGRHDVFMRGIMSLAGRDGGDRRDRTDDLKLAKLPLSQLSYGPERQTDTIESKRRIDDWWAWEDLNLRPHAYQARALTN